MTTINQAATDFLAHERIAVTGVSSKPKGHGSNTVYQRLRERGYDVFAVNRTPITSKVTPAITTSHRSPAASTPS